MDKEKIRLSNGQIYNIDDLRYKFNLFEIDFDNDIDVDGLINDPSIFNKITILTRNEEECGSYDGYNTIYSVDGNTITLSNDKSVYVEPSINNPILTEEIEYIPTIAEVRQSKLCELSNICNDTIEHGVDLDINGVTEHFSYKIEDQNNIKDKFDIAIKTRMDVPYHSDGGSIKKYTSEQIINLYISEKLNLAHHATYFNQLKMYINTLEDIDSISSIAYGCELTGKYLENYNNAIEQETLALNTLIDSVTKEAE